MGGVFPGSVRLRKKGAKTSNANANPANSANVGMRNASLFARLAGLAFASFQIADPSAVLCDRVGFTTKKGERLSSLPSLNPEPVSF